MNLSELLQEAKTLNHPANIDGDLWRGRRALEILPRLVAVAEAAQWVANDMRYRAPEQAAGLYRTLWLEHLDSALASPATGAGEEGEK